ncbi:glycosyltransferase family 39 protein [Sphingomonas sp.]|uniref:glycosyltransferase family 39 protein n=1 Tax=Sphingomonas sp. TaxID=28214 RepID=UPI0035BBB15E
MLVILLALGRLWWLPAHAPLNVNEGWNAGHAVRAFGSALLYPAPDALVANNYPPLSFFVVGAVGHVVGDHIVAGRIVSLLAEMATGGAVYAIVARLTGARIWAAAGALLFAGFAVTLLRSYLAMNDPQWLGQAMMAWALVLLVPRHSGERASAGAVVAAAALVVAGGLVKHNLVAIPLAATLWLWFADRRALAVWVAAGAAFAAAACAGLFAIWGPNVFLDVLAPARSYSLARMAAQGAPLLLALLPGFLASRPLVAQRRVDPRYLLPLLLLAVAISTAIVQRSGDGVDINATFESIFALTIAVPAACALRPAAPWRWLGTAALPVLVLAPVAVVADVRELAGRGAAVRHWQPFIDRVAAASGPVACDDQAVCYWAGKESALDFFAIKQRLLKGDVPAFRTALDSHAFELIAMRSNNPGWHENRLIPAVRARYRPVYADGGFELLVAR